MFLPKFRRRKSGVFVTRIQPARAGKVHPILLWLLGVPIPVIILLLLLRGCTGWP